MQQATISSGSTFEKKTQEQQNKNKHRIFSIRAAATMKTTIVISNLLILLVARVSMGFVHPFHPITSSSTRYNVNVPPFDRSAITESQRIQSTLITKRKGYLVPRLSKPGKYYNNVSDNKTVPVLQGDKTNEISGKYSSTIKKALVLSENEMSRDHHGKNVSATVQSTNPNIDARNNNNSKSSSKGGLLGSYFPFLQQTPQSSTRGGSQNAINLGTGNGNFTAATMILNKASNETITVADLETFLSRVQFPPYIDPVQEKDLPKAPVVYKRSSTYTGGESKKGSTAGSTKKASAAVAFPQPSVLSERELQRGTTIAGFFLGMIVAITVLPNLWLVGMAAGSFYGYEITKELSPEQRESRGDPNSFDKLLISCGRQIAKAYLKVIDSWKGLWFLYKTGQLSYEYYKTYENLDQKFAIQSKVDAWNKVFVEGKRKFDAWEQENEVGRTVLAGLRTAWLVDEQSKRRASRRSRYRVVQVAYDIKYSITRLIQRLFSSVKSLFQEGEMKTYLTGLRTDMNRKSSLAARIGPIGAAILVVNLVGAMFSISPAFCNFLAVLVAIVWPSWGTDLISSLRERGSEIKSSGSARDRNSLPGNSVKVFDPVKFVRRKCDAHNGNNSKEAKRNKPSKSFTPFAPARKQRTGSTSTSFGFNRGWKKRNRSRRTSGEVGTWGNYNRR